MSEWFYGIVGLSFWIPLLFTLISTHLTFVAITVYLHRFSAHRALELHPAVQHVMRFWLWISTGMSTKAWTAVHRCHHAHTETEEDPHSPVIQGLGQIVFNGVHHYRKAITPELLAKYGKGTPDDWLEHHVYTTKEFIGVGSLLVVDLILFGVVGLAVWGVQMLWTPFWAAGVINGIGHAWGYRNFECPDHAKNIVPWGILICGEELHNNHHTYPNSPKLSVKKWEVDFGWGWIRFFEFFGLAKPHRVGPVMAKDKTKSEFDLDSVAALINDRYNVMAKFGKKVVAPLVRDQYRQESDSTLRTQLRRAKSLIVRDESVLSNSQKTRLNNLIEAFPNLEVVHSLRVHLSEIWQSRNMNRSELIASLKEWCQLAEEKLQHLGYLQELQAFMDELKSYTLPQQQTATA